ncbi:hypothetical protein ACFL1G_01340 [Planctomycetota bacterium]
MKKIVFICMCLLFTAGIALADWDEGDGHKMHYPQLPKLGGLDVAFNFSRLADDWKCSQTGPVEDIHFWVSWQYDDVQPIDGFSVRIWSDNPGGPDGYSEPNELLWERDFDIGQFTVRDMPDDLQGWFDPFTGLYNSQDHFIWQQVNIMDIADPYTQEEGMIYWLEIDMWGTGPTCGWKESGSPHFTDDAVVWDSPRWLELRHPETSESLDLAFVITGEVPKEPIKHLKWSQPPIEIDPTLEIPVYCGWDELSYYLDIAFPIRSATPSVPAGTVVGTSTDGVSPTQGTVKSVPASAAIANVAIFQDHNPWGSTWNQDILTANGISYTIHSSADIGVVNLLVYDKVILASQQDESFYAAVDANRPYFEGFASGGGCLCMHLAAFSDVPIENYTMPGGFVAGAMQGYEDVTIVDATHPIVTTPHAITDANLDNWSFSTHTWFTAYPHTAGEIIEEASTGNPCCMETQYGAGKILATVQPVEWGGASYNYLENMILDCIPAAFQAKLVADDFRCLGAMPVTSLHWWGSHFGWEEPGAAPPQQPVAWQIGFWSNNPGVDFSYPEELLWQIIAPADRVEVEEVGTDEYIDYPYDICYQYTLFLETEEYFWQQEFLENTNDDIFWVSIAAIYDPDVDLQFPWGWKTRPEPWMDDAVSIYFDGPINPGMVITPDIVVPIEDPCGKSMDVAFELDTDPNFIKWEQPFTGIRDWPHYWDEYSMAVKYQEPITKWLQWPDLSTLGIDVDATNDDWFSSAPQIVADDFECTQTGPITDIHLWTSWYHDITPEEDPANVAFTLHIYSDDPCGPDGTDPENRYSKPDKLLWSQDFTQGTFNVDIYAEGLEEGYYIPCEPYWEFPGDSICFKYDFYIDSANAFPQEGTPDEPVIYWLAVQAHVQPQAAAEPVRLGWKTSTDHWNDDAVWAVTGELPWDWQELRHPETGESLDMAFEITTEQQEPELYRLVADDWKCSQIKPVTALSFWGSYEGYLYEACQPMQMAPPAKPDYFLLQIWTDTPASGGATSGNCCYPHPWPGCDDPICEASVCSYDPYCCDVMWDSLCAQEALNDPCCDCGLEPFSHPNDIIWEYKAYDYDEVLVGFDKFPEGEPGPREAVFRYSVRLPEENWFLQEDVNNIYWLSIVAVYDETVHDYFWGWTNHEHVFNDNAVAGWYTLDPDDPEEGWYWEPLYDQTWMSEDMSFILFTEPVCGNLTPAQIVTWQGWGAPLPQNWCNLCWRCGDVNGDGFVTFGDVIQTFNYFNDATSNGEGDVNMDGFETFGDVIAAFNHFKSGQGCTPLYCQ